MEIKRPDRRRRRMQGFLIVKLPLKGKSRLKGGLILRGRWIGLIKFNRLKKKTPQADAGLLTC